LVAWLRATSGEQDSCETISGFDPFFGGVKLPVRQEDSMKAVLLARPRYIMSFNAIPSTQQLALSFAFNFLVVWKISALENAVLVAAIRILGA